MSYQPASQFQLDGSRCASANCGPTTFSIATDLDWLGTRKGSPVPVRNAIGLYCPGTNSLQNRDAIRGLYATVVTPEVDVPWSMVADALRARRGVAIVIRYSVLHGTPFDSCRSFDGLHWIFACDLERDASGNEVPLVYDPLADGRYSWIPRGAKRWPLSLLQKAATSVQADGYVDAAFTRSTVNPKKALYSGGALRSGAGVNFAQKGAINFGSLYAVRTAVPGGAWTVNGKTGTAWYPVTAIDGVKLASTLYAAAGWFAGASGATA